MGGSEAEPNVQRLDGGALPRVMIANIARIPAGHVFAEVAVQELEINVISSGRTRASLNGAPLLLAAGHAYVYRPGDRISAVGEPGDDYTCRWVKYSWPAAAGDELGVALPRVVPLTPSVRGAVLAVFDELIEEHAMGSPDWRFHCCSHLLRLISLLRRASAARGARHGADSADGRRLQIGLRFMERHLAQSLTLRDVARAALLSEDYFARLFRRRLGVSPMQHLIRLRVQAGRRLLAEDPSMSVAAASARVGIGDPGHFARLFRRHFAITPSGFRLQLAARGADQA